MKVSVLTLNRVNNYGSVLQTYATQKLLESLGCEVEIIDYYRRENRISGLIKQYTSKDMLLVKVLKVIVLMPTFIRFRYVFSTFLEKYVKLSRTYSSAEELKNYPLTSEIFLVGSDQVWNSWWNGGILKEFFLDFVPSSKCLVSYASSFGKERLEDWEIEETKALLKRFSAISVRESSAVKIIDELGIPGSLRVLDPTLMLNRDFWLNFSSVSKKKIDGDYILLYQLNSNKDFDRYAVKMAEKYKCKLIRFCTRYDQFRLSGSPLLLPSVESFVALLNDAKYVLTDSFHATAFCINLNKEFACLYPNMFSSRLRDLLQDCELEDRVINGYDQFEMFERKTDFTKSNIILDAERKKSMNFLSKAIFRG